jgi:hypothetical protein
LAKPNSKNLFPAVPEVTPEAVILDALPLIPCQVTLPSIPCLPNGDFQSWKHFLQNGGYVSAKGKVMSTNKQTQALAFVSPILNPTIDEKWRNGFKERQVKFHCRIKKLEKSLAMPLEISGRRVF